MYLFFGKNQVHARAELRRGMQWAESELFLLCFHNFFFMFSVFRALAAAREQSQALLFRKMMCAKPAARRVLLFHKLPHNICARKACCLQSSPLSASYTNHTFFRRTEIWKPFVAELQKQSMIAQPSLAAVTGQPLPLAPVARQLAPIAGQSPSLVSVGRLVGR